MEPPTAVAALLALCLALILFVYVLGVEVGRAASETRAKKRGLAATA